MHEYKVSVGHEEQGFTLADGSTIRQLYTTARAHFGLPQNPNGLVFKGATSKKEFQLSDTAPKDETIIISERK